MANKETKPGFDLKPQKDDWKGEPGKPSQEKHAEKEEAKRLKKMALEETKARAKSLKFTADGMREQIMKERAQLIHGPSSIQAEIDQTRLAWEKVQSDLDQVKGLSRKRKDEIDEWKAWYENLSMEEKPSGLERLQKEIGWRADDLSSNGEKINELNLRELEARGAYEMAILKLEAFHAGVHKRPLEEDPRLVGVMAELDKETASVAQLESEQTRQE